jgi:hypothetical protein
MPSAVFGVYEAFYQGTGFWTRSVFSLARWKMESILLSPTAGMGSMYGVDTYMSSMFSTNLLNSLGKEPLLYDFNRLTGIMQIHDKGDRTGAVICKVARCLQPSQLYKDTWYRRYIIGHVLNARADQLELFGAQLPGDAAINVGVLRNRAEALLDQVTQHLEDENAADFYVVKS